MTTEQPATETRVFFAPIPVDEIARNPHQPRRAFAPESLADLAHSLATEGQLQPIAVRRVDCIDPDDPARPCRYMLILGERRLRAARLIPWPQIEAKVFEGMTEAEADCKAIVENLEREKLNPMEEAEGVAALKSRHGYTQETITERVYHGKKSRSRVANLLRLLGLPADVQEMLRAASLNQSQSEALLRFVEFPAVLSAIAALAAKRGTSSSELERGLPFAQELDKAGIIVALDEEDFDGTDLDYLGDAKVFKKLKALSFIRVVKPANNYADDDVYVLDPRKWEEWIAARREECAEARRKAAAKKQRELEAARAMAAGTTDTPASAGDNPAEASAATPPSAPPLVDLGKLGYSGFVYLDSLPASIRKQIPADKIGLAAAQWTDEHHGKGEIVEITREVGLVRNLQAQVSAKKNKVVRAELDAALDCALENIRAIKTLGSEDFAALTHYIVQPKYLDEEDYAAVGIQRDYRGSIAATAFFQKLEPLQMLQVVLVHQLRMQWSEDRRNATKLAGPLEAYGKGWEKRLAKKTEEAARAKAAKSAGKEGKKKPAAKAAK